MAFIHTFVARLPNTLELCLVVEMGENEYNNFGYSTRYICLSMFFFIFIKKIM